MLKTTMALALSIACAAIGSARAEDTLTYHGGFDRSGNVTVPAVTSERARQAHPDNGFDARIDGHLYAQPLFWRQGESGPGVLFVATESNDVEALDAQSGKPLWKRSLGAPVARSALPCGNINPLGVTGTPVIDPAAQVLYLDAAVGGAAGMRHLVFGLSVRDGTPLPGWPIDVAQALKQHGMAFDARAQNERGALTILNGRLYVPFGGHFGDCGDYHGWVVGISLQQPHDVVAWSTQARGGGVWAPGGITTDGQSLLVATGNTFGASRWMDGEAVLRLSSDLKLSGDRKDFFTPENWRALDARDADLGGTNPVLVDVPGNGGNRAFVLALGKDGDAYLLDRDNLGGIGGSVVNEEVSSRPIRTAPATYPGGGGAFVAFEGPGSGCPAGHAGDLTVLEITAGERAALRTAWCGAVRGGGSPIVTTTDGHSDPVV